MTYNCTDLLEKAKTASQNAYIPYSKFPVGACVLYESKKMYTGCNVENASYGLALCAERNAISTAIASGENTKPIAIAIYSPEQKQCMPCGACRQWIFEFNPDCLVVVEDENSYGFSSYKISKLLPNAFGLQK